MQNNLMKMKEKFGIKIESDFSFNAFSFLIMTMAIAVMIVLELSVFKVLTSDQLLIFVSVVVSIMIAIPFLPTWNMMMVCLIMSGVYVYTALPHAALWEFGIVALGLLIACTVEMVYEWDKVVILRMGRFHRVHSPGMFVLLPIFDRVTERVDTRIRVTDFKAEKSLTRDTVPVYVDALAFWMIWDPEKATLEVENYMEAVVLSAQTALRDSIGKFDLRVLLSEREVICDQIQKNLDSKTNPWGITILSVEIHEIIIPQALEDAMSKEAQAEREKNSRIILGTAEVEIAKKFEEAALNYKGNPEALQLRAMNMVYEGMKNNGSLVLLPTEALSSLNVGAASGLKVLAESERNKKAMAKGENDDQA